MVKESRHLRPFPLPLLTQQADRQDVVLRVRRGQAGQEELLHLLSKATRFMYIYMNAYASAGPSVVYTLSLFVTQLRMLIVNR